MNISKHNLVYGLVGIIIGMILGVIIGNIGPSPNAAVAQSAPAAAQTTPPSGLPDGHPPVDANAMEELLIQQKAILEKEPENQEALVRTANLLYDLKKFAEANIYYEKALEKDGTNLDLITDLGTSYFYSNNPEKALELYNRSLAINSTHFQSLMNTGIVKMTIGDKTGAAQALEKVLQHYPEIPEATEIRETIHRLRTS